MCAIRILMYLFTKSDINHHSAITAKSPVFSHVTTTLSGLLTIRSCSATPRLRHYFDYLQDTHTSAHFLVVASSVAFGFWIDVVSVVFVALVGYSVILVPTACSYVGLAMTQVIGLCGSMQSCLKNYADSVGQMTNVERMFHIIELKQEEVTGEGESEVVGRTRPPLFWPCSGEIRFDKVSLRYSEEGEPALTDLSFTVRAGTKVCI